MTPFLDRLQQRGVTGRVICLSRGEAPPDDARVLEVPNLGNRWLQPLTLRQLHLDSSPAQRRVLHVLGEAMAATGIATAEAWSLPYLQTVREFETLEQGMKVSRRWFRGIVATSPELADELVRVLGFPAERVELIAPGVPPVLPSPRAAEQRIPVIGTAGPVRESSGFAVFLEAARQVLATGRDAEFLIATQGPDTLNLRRRAQWLHIAERVSVSDLEAIGPRFWTVLDLFCQPSLVPSTGRTLILAMSQCVPAVATEVMGLRALTDHGASGLLVPAGQPEPLARAISTLLDHPDQAALLARRGQASIRARFDLEIEADLLAALYRRHATWPQADPPV